MNVRATNDRDNPYLAPETVPEPIQRPAIEPYFWFRILVVLHVLLVAIGLGLSYLTIESIMITGAILVVLGILTFATAYRRRSLAGIVLGASGVIFSVGVFLLVVLMDWGPADAKGPVPILIAIYFAITIALATVALLHAPQINNSVASQEPPF